MPEAPQKPDKKAVSSNLHAILEWIYSLPLSSRQQAVLLVHGHHCDYWTGENSCPGTETIMRKARLNSKRRVQQIHEELVADPLCRDCEFTGKLRGTTGKSVRCPCHLLQRGPLILTAEPRGNRAGIYRLNFGMRPWRPVQLPLADPLPQIVSRSSTVSTVSTEGEIPKKISPGAERNFRSHASEISQSFERNFEQRNKEDRKNRLKSDRTSNTLARAAAEPPRPSRPTSQRPSHVMRDGRDSFNYTPDDLAAWLNIKSALQKRLGVGEWNRWIRAARLLWARSSGHLMIAVPNNSVILASVVEHKLISHEIAAQFGRRILWTRYLDDYERGQLQSRFGRELRRKQPTGTGGSRSGEKARG